ncbi:MAG: 50S ribosomal protein L19 [Candidatus Harrisonbacteria bacterium CG10_big_fil_rev_8_21_14_0_10_49_15]|uniref:50S ribosomal protein L19 n=1 Tax=Candidatus Harrisonbacteria bacterium CG10_big_fil_rev_8_21_14_0_10_49_15 TaxID=1974587 RepID=A0A2H0UL25_9BACT|nr:MAG: 50S ribosomal protein L19 [Candidatus Harrisonbacteria bacterium CG10_big_fil_rev_8_21_14_0_10_49_15]
MIHDLVNPKIRPGATVRVFETIQEGGKERVRRFEGMVLARKHGNEPGASFTVRSTVAGVGVEKVFPVHSQTISKVEVLSSPKNVRRSKLYYIRDISRKMIRKKTAIKEDVSGEVRAELKAEAKAEAKAVAEAKAAEEVKVAAEEQAVAEAKAKEEADAKKAEEAKVSAEVNENTATAETQNTEETEETEEAPKQEDSKTE